jgi:hypothetical protein
MEVRSAVGTILVILVVLVSSGLGAPNVVNSQRPANANASEELKVFVDLNRVLPVIMSMVENMTSWKVFDLMPRQIKSFAFLIKKVLYFAQTFGKRLRELLLNPQKLESDGLLYIVTLALTVLSFTPGFMLPTRVIIFLLSSFKIFSHYWATFGKDSLAQLQDLKTHPFIL